MKVRSRGVCHTDLHYREGGINDEFPFLLGHEAAGIVEDVGEGVTSVAPGDFVVLNWRAVCGQCRACLRGRPWYCFQYGTVVLVRIPTPEIVLELPLLDLFGRGGALKSSWYGDCLPSRDFPMLVDLYLQGRLDLDAFVSETIGLDEVAKAFEKTYKGAVLRSVVVF